jgi:hypothetical protein
MASKDPPAVREDRGSRHVVQEWTVELRRGGEPITVRGDIVWVPPPSPWPWLLASAALAAGVVAASRARRWRLPVAAAVVLAIGAVSAHVLGGWGATTASVASRLGESIYPLGGVALALVALALLLTRDDPSDSTPALLMAGLVLALGSGLADISSLWHSQLPSTQPAALDRLEVATALGLGLGLAAAGALRLRSGRELQPRPERLPA